MVSRSPFLPFSESAERLLARAGVTLDAESGVLVAWSGGADSTFLLRVLLVLREKYGFPLAALHVEHGIRGEESRRDAAFCVDKARELGVPLTVVSVDVPAVCRETGESVELAARRLRYGALRSELASRPGFRYIATAHNRDDAAETVLFRLLRGCGTDGASGIRAARGDLIRPILDVPSQTIRETLAELGIPFVCDSTNADPFCARNYLRNEIFPRLARITPDPGKMLSDAARRFREDDDYLSFLAAAVPTADRSRRSALASLPDPILKRVLISEFRRFTPVMPEAVHIDAAVVQIRKERDGAIAFPAGIVFSCVGDAAGFAKTGRESGCEPVDLTPGGTAFIPFSGDVAGFYRFDGASETFASSNVYKLSKKVILSSATIEGSVTVRAPRPGDRIVYGGMTHEVRTVLSQHKVPRDVRCSYPLFCDAKGVFWIPGLAVRDGCDGRNAFGEVFVFHISGGLSDRVKEYAGRQDAGANREGTDV